MARGSTGGCWTQSVIGVFFDDSCYGRRKNKVGFRTEYLCHVYPYDLARVMSSVHGSSSQGQVRTVSPDTLSSTSPGPLRGAGTTKLK